MNTFLPEKYEVPKSPSNYFTFEQGQNKFRVVSSSIVGFEYWTEEIDGKTKPVRLPEMPEERPDDMRKDSKIKHFWAFEVIDRTDGKIKVCEITQKTIMKAIKALVDNADWGDPKGYDITISKTGEKLDTEYAIQPSPHKELTTEELAKVEFTKVNLNALFTGENPFETPDVNPELAQVD